MERTEAFRILASVDRQLLLHELVERNGEATAGELSRDVAARRHRTKPAKLDDEAIRRARVRLVHTHIPELADRDVLEYDERDAAVSLTDEESVERLFDAAEELDSWPPDDVANRPPL